MARLTEFEVTLESPIMVSQSGEMVETETVLLVAPKGKHSRTCDAIRGIHGYAQKQMALFGKEAGLESSEQTKEAEEKKEEKAESLKTVIMMAIGDNDKMVERLSNLTRKLLVEGCCKVGNKDINDHIIDERMDARDYDKIVWEYLANFLLTS